MDDARLTLKQYLNYVKIYQDDDKYYHEYYHEYFKVDGELDIQQVIAKYNKNSYLERKCEILNAIYTYIIFWIPILFLVLLSLYEIASGLVIVTTGTLIMNIYDHYKNNNKRIKVFKDYLDSKLEDYSTYLISGITHPLN